MTLRSMEKEVMQNGRKQDGRHSVKFRKTAVIIFREVKFFIQIKAFMYYSAEMIKRSQLISIKTMMMKYMMAMFLKSFFIPVLNCRNISSLK